MNKSSKRKYSLLSGFIIKNIPWLTLAFLILLSSGLVRTYGTSYIVKITDAIEAHTSISLVFELALVCFLLSTAGYITRLMGSILCTWLTEKLAYETRLKIVTHLQKIPFIAYEKYDIGNLQSILRNDVTIASNIMYNMFSRIMQNIILFFVTLWYMCIINFEMAIIVSGLSIVMTIINQRILARLKKYEKINRAAVGDVSSIVLSCCNGMTTIKTHKAYKYILDMFKKAKKKFNDSSFMVEKIDAGRLTVYNIANNLSMYIAILYFSYMAIQDKMSIGEVLVFITLIRQIMIPIDVIFRWMSKLVTSFAAWDRIHDILDEEIDMETTINSAIPDKTINVNGLTFSYKNGKSVFNNLNLAFEKGKLHAISGESGSGKTTLYKILLGLYHADATMKLDKKDFDNCDMSAFATFAPAETVLFNMSIYDNLVFDNKSITKEECLVLADKLGIGEWLRSLPDGLDTMVVSGGKNFSGGQRQMLGTMRSIFSGKPVWVLDEVFASLDVDKKDYLMKYLKEEKHNHFIIITSHSPEIMAECDSVIRL